MGGTLSTIAPGVLKTNWTSEHSSAFYADLYKQHDLTGAHVIMLGPGIDQAAEEALNAWQGGMQVGGGITDKNAAEWIAKGAERVSRGSQATGTCKLMGHSVGNHNIVSLYRLQILHGPLEGCIANP